jgi:hypothetical protein
MLFRGTDSVFCVRRLKEDWKWTPDNWDLEVMMRSEMLKRFQEMSPVHEQYVLYRQLLATVLKPLPRVHDCLKQSNRTIPVELQWSSVALALAATAGGRNGLVEALWEELKMCAYSKAQDITEPVVLALQNDGDEVPSGTCMYSCTEFIFTE